MKEQGERVEQNGTFRSIVFILFYFNEYRANALGGREKVLLKVGSQCLVSKFNPGRF